MRKAFVLTFAVLLAFSSAALAHGQQPADHWANYQGTKIRYYDIGGKKTDKALVLVHCWAGNADLWKATYSAFPNHRVIVMDLPGHGQSDKPRIDYSMEYFARSVEAVMKKAGVKKAVLAGHSMGTPIIRRFYELYPEKTLGLVLVDGALLSFGPRAEVQQFFQPLFDDYKTGSAKFIDGLLEPAHAEVRPVIRSTMMATPDYVAQSAMKLMLDDAYVDHGKINVPVLAVMAPSPYWPKDLEAQYRAIAPKLEFTAWTGVSHFLMMERPKDFNELVASFITSNKLL